MSTQEKINLAKSEMVEWLSNEPYQTNIERKINIDYYRSQLELIDKYAPGTKVIVSKIETYGPAHKCWERGVDPEYIHLEDVKAEVISPIVDGGRIIFRVNADKGYIVLIDASRIKSKTN